MQSLAIRNIRQLDNHNFQIEWMDGATGLYNLNALQKNCPCAKCIDEATGTRRASAPESLMDVRAKNICSVGRYALKITFTSGCSTGIYDYAWLHSLAYEFP
ncbi:MAG: DUF971 domain-containing protein [Parachlamydiaceae bacterium]|nr:DUF971 domain-containing protein [Parachlamydiaceae bacterium]